MATLTETAYYTRRTINWSFLVLGTYIVLRISWAIVSFIWLVFFPPQALPPNHAFGNLPVIKFPQAASTSGQLTFQLETIQGGIPAASPSATVYFMPKTAPTLLGLNNAQEFAAKLQLDPNPIQENKNVYRFNDPKDPLRRLRYDIVSKNFILRYSFEQDSSIFLNKDLPFEDAAKEEATTLLQSNGIYPQDIEDGTKTVTYLRLQNNVLIPTTSSSQGDAARVGFFRKSLGGIPIRTPSPQEAAVSIILSGASGLQKRVLQLAYTYWPIDYETTATYALKSTTVAWEELQQGKGYIAQYPLYSQTATVRSVYLAYYDSFEPQTYLQPIFVFEGDNGFMGYVPAVSAEWVE